MQSRAVLALPLYIPPIMLLMIEKMKMMPRGKYPKMLVELGVIAFELYFAIPFACSFYLQEQTINIALLEDHIIKAAADKGIKELRFNKGL